MSVAKVPLKGSQPDIRVSAGGIQPLCQTPMVGRTDAFVEHLLQRYTHSALPWSYPDRVFRHFLPGMTWSPIYYQPQLQLMPHLSFTVLNRNETFQTTPVLPLPMPATLTVIRDKDVVRSTPMQSAPFMPVTLTVVHGKDATQSTSMQLEPFMPVTLTVVHGKDAAQPTSMQLEPFMPVALNDSASKPMILKIQSIVEERFIRQTLRQTLQQKDLVQQLIKQTKRIEAGAGMPTETLEVLPTFRPANRVVRRTGAVLVESDVTPPTPEQSWMAPRGFPGISQGQTVEGTNAIDVNRLTDQVIQAIDRRMIAYRERSGRI